MLVTINGKQPYCYSLELLGDDYFSQMSFRYWLFGFESRARSYLLNLIGMKSCYLLGIAPGSLALGYIIFYDSKIISILAYQEEQLIRIITSP